MSFSIELSDEKPEELELGEKAVVGHIRIGEFAETFTANTAYWEPARYRAQWRESLQRFLNGAKSTCLIVDMANPARANFIVWWLLYDDNGRIAIQNGLLFLERRKFDEMHPYDNLPPLERVTADGELTSIWEISRAELEEFFEKL